MWKIKKLKLDNGERIYLPLIDGIPVFYPTYYVTRKLRDKSPNTQRNKLKELRLLVSWEVDSNTSLVDRIQQGGDLSEREIQNLADFCGYTLDTIRVIESGVTRLKPAYRYVSNTVKRYRLQTISNYLEFLYTVVCKDPDRDAQAKRLKHKIRGHVPRKVNHLNVRDEQSLTDDQIDVLTEKLLPGNPENPFNDEALQYRNLLMLHLLYETGMRQGELLGLYVEDVDFRESVVKIRRRHHDPADPRIDQPLQKSRERDIPIPEDLLHMILFYISDLRGRSNKARKHPVLFVGHYNKNEGNALSASGLRYVFSSLVKAFPVLKGVHPHLMRHHFNYRFSIMLDNGVEGWDDMTAEERAAFDETARSDLMGWKTNSDMQKTYNKRYNIEIRNKALRKRSETYKGISPDKDSE